MKTPEKSLPSENAAIGSAKIPDIQISGENAATSSSPGPTKSPPSEVIQSTQGGIGAVAWQPDKRINALFNSDDPRNSYMSVVGTGWVKLGSATDSANLAFSILASHAKEKGSRIDYGLDGSVCVEMYVY